jgi:selenocysteine lyase/cysteine desulfurase
MASGRRRSRGAGSAALNPKPETLIPKPQTPNPKRQTGLGALVVRRDAVSAALNKRVFAGGSVLSVDVEAEWFRLRSKVSERLEDGTPNFLSILAAAQGLEMLQVNPEPETQTLNPKPWTLNPQPSTPNPQPSTLEMLQGLGMRTVAAHTWSLRDYLAREFERLEHANGIRLVELYGPPPGSGVAEVGSIVAFNLRREDGGYVEYTQV